MSSNPNQEEEIKRITNSERLANDVASDDKTFNLRMDVKTNSIDMNKLFREIGTIA